MASNFYELIIFRSQMPHGKKLNFVAWKFNCIHTNISDEIVWPLSCVNKMLAVIVMRVGTLCSLRKTNKQTQTNKQTLR